VNTLYEEKNHLLGFSFIRVYRYILGVNNLGYFHNGGDRKFRFGLKLSVSNIFIVTEVVIFRKA
jgi:hypothetical protein